MSGRDTTIAFKDQIWGYHLGPVISGTGKSRIAFPHMSVDDRQEVEAILREYETVDDGSTDDGRYVANSVFVVPYQPLRCSPRHLDQVCFRAPKVELVPQVVIGYFEILGCARSIALELTDGIHSFIKNNPDDADFEDFYERIFSKLNEAFAYRNNNKLLTATNPLNAYVKPVVFHGETLASNIKCLIMNMHQFYNHATSANAEEIAAYASEEWQQEWVDEPVVFLEGGTFEPQWVCGYKVKGEWGDSSDATMESDATVTDESAANPQGVVETMIISSGSLIDKIVSGFMAPVRVVDKPNSLLGLMALAASEAQDLIHAPGLLHEVENGSVNRSDHSFWEGPNVKQYIYFNPPDNQLRTDAVRTNARYQKVRERFVTIVNSLEEVAMLLEGDRIRLPSDVNSLRVVRDDVIKALGDVFKFKHDHGNKLGALGYFNPFDAMIYITKPYAFGKINTKHVYGNVKCALLLLHWVISEKGGYDISDTDPDEWVQIPREWHDEWINEKVFLLNSMWFCGLKVMKDGVGDPL